MQLVEKKIRIGWMAGILLTLFVLIGLCGTASTAYADNLTPDWTDPSYVKMIRGNSGAEKNITAVNDTTGSESSLAADENDTALESCGTGVSSTTILTDRFLHKTYTHESSKLSGATLRYGVDVSKWQGTVDWDKAKAAGVEFAILRIGYTKTTEYTMYKDEKFEDYLTDVQSVGIPYGIYYFSQATTAAEAAAEAQYTLKLLNGRKLDLPIVFDYETQSGWRNYGLSKAQGTAICKAYCEVIRAAGYTPMVYGNKSCLYSDVDTAALEKQGYLIWIARYNSIAYETSWTGYIPDYCMWQYSESGTVSGFSTSSVDLDVWYDDGSVSGTGTSSGSTTVSTASSSGSSGSTESSSETVTAPGTPSGVEAASAAGSSVTLSWSEVSGAEGYVIVRADGYGCTYSTVETTDETSFTDTGLTAGREYWYRVRAYKLDSSGNRVYGSYSAKTAGTTTASCSCRVKVSASSLTIRSQAGSSYSSKGSLSKGAYAVLLACTYGTDGDLWYKVSASVSGSSVTGYISGKYSAPYVAKVTGVKQTAKTGTVITLAWTKQSYVKGYQVYRAEAYNGTYTRVSNFSAGTVTCTDSGRTAHQQYFYRVRSYITVNGKNIFGAWSDISLFTTGATKLLMKTTAAAGMNTWNGSGFSKLCNLPADTKLTAYYRLKDKSGNWWFYCTGTVNGKTVKGYVRRSLLAYRS